MSLAHIVSHDGTNATFPDGDVQLGVPVYSVTCFFFYGEYTLDAAIRLDMKGERSLDTMQAPSISVNTA